MAEELIWTESGGKMNAGEVVADFAAHYWPEPRAVTILADGRFRLADGLAMYRIGLEGGAWRIYRQSAPAAAGGRG